MATTTLGREFEIFCETVAKLRDPIHGCPWDLEQTHASLRRYMIEEAYEAVDVMDPVDTSKLKGELGDVLLQVVLNAQIGKDQGTFDVTDVIHGIDQKMRRRHPHVFSPDDHDAALAMKEAGDIDALKASIKTQWQKIKKQEQALNHKSALEAPHEAGVFDGLSIAKSGRPALQLAIEIGKIARHIDFDWSNVHDVFEQFRSEVTELGDELRTETARNNKARIYEELSDVFFALGQLCRHLDIDPEICAHDGNQKFLRRFKSLERIAQSEQINVTTAGTAELERLWKLAKAQEKK